MLQMLDSRDRTPLLWLFLGLLYTFVDHLKVKDVNVLVVDKEIVLMSQVGSSLAYSRLKMVRPLL